MRTDHIKIQIPAIIPKIVASFIFSMKRSLSKSKLYLMQCGFNWSLFSMSHLYFIFLKLSIIFCTICLCNITNSSYRSFLLFRGLRKESKTLFTEIQQYCTKKQTGSLVLWFCHCAQVKNALYMQVLLRHNWECNKVVLMPFQ